MKVQNPLVAMSIAFFCFSSLGRADVVSAVESCIAIDDDISRLSCFDNLAKEVATLDKETANPTDDEVDLSASSGKWLVGVEIDPLYDTRVFYALLTSDTKSTSLSAPKLVISCQQKSATIFIAWEDFLANNTEVTIRFGDEKPSSFKWDAAEGETSTFLYEARHAWFFRKAMEVDRVVAQIKPYRSGPITAIFDVQGMRTALEGELETCGIQEQ